MYKIDCICCDCLSLKFYLQGTKNPMLTGHLWQMAGSSEDEQASPEPVRTVRPDVSMANAALRQLLLRNAAPPASPVNPAPPDPTPPGQPSPAAYRHQSHDSTVLRMQLLTVTLNSQFSPPPITR